MIQDLIQQYGVSGETALDLMRRMDYIRVVGTAGEERAAAQLLAELEAMGVSAHTESFDFPRCVAETARLMVLEPYQKEYIVTAYGFTGNADLEAELFYAENGDEISLSMAKGKLVLLNTPVSVALYRKLAASGAAGFLTISGTPLDDPEKTDLEMRALKPSYHLRDGLPKIPGATLRYLDAEELLEREARRIRLLLDQKEEIAKANNIVAEIPGTDGGDGMIVFTAHYDSVPFSPGAYDNSAGCAIIMELCRYFTRVPPKRRVRFLWFSGEEIGLIGSHAYCAAHRAELNEVLFGVNVDLAGHIVGSHLISVTGEHSVREDLEKLMRENGVGMEFLEEVCSSDSSSLADCGVPTLGFRRGGFGGHNRNDRLSLISAKALQQSSAVLCLLADYLVNQPEFPFPRSIPPKLQEDLDRYFARV
ncbi:MAG: M28 family peptidase [Candidatus Merdivicinus sp.]|jgi:Iap family predicted aminopeptidase